MPTTKQKKTKKRTLAQRAGVYRSKLKRAGVETLKDHKGNEVPVDYVPALDLLKHMICEELIQESKGLQAELAAFKAKCQNLGDNLYDRMMEEEDIRPNSVGGFRLNNFEKSLYVDFKMDTVQVVDDEQIALAKEYKDKFVEEAYGNVDPVMMEILNEVFENTKGKVDPRLGQRLNKYRSRVKNKSFRNFLDHFNQAFDINHTKRYEKFMERNDQGEYDSILLTYSKLSPEKSEDETG